MDQQRTRELRVVELELLMYIFLALNFLKAILLLFYDGSWRRCQDILSAIGGCVDDLKSLWNRVLFQRPDLLRYRIVPLDVLVLHRSVLVL